MKYSTLALGLFSASAVQALPQSASGSASGSGSDVDQNQNLDQFNTTAAQNDDLGGELGLHNSDVGINAGDANNDKVWTNDCFDCWEGPITINGPVTINGSANGAIVGPWGPWGNPSSWTAPPTLQGTNGAKILGFILPNEIKTHNNATNINTLNEETFTVNNDTVYTSTLYSIPIPPEVGEFNCTTLITPQTQDIIGGSAKMIMFNNGFGDNLDNLTEGTLRENELAVFVFIPGADTYGFDVSEFPPTIANFPCPAGKTLAWETVTEGTPDVNIVGQDYVTDGLKIPHGLSLAFY